jgi:hypothetical protein
MEVILNLIMISMAQFDKVYAMVQELAPVERVKFAISEDRVVLTLNRKDFIRLHKQKPNHAGIIV